MLHVQHAILGFVNLQQSRPPSPYLCAELLPAAQLLQQLLRRQAAPRVPRHRHCLAAQVAIGESQGEVAWVRIDERHQGRHTGGGGIGLLDINPTCKEGGLELI